MRKHTCKWLFSLLIIMSLTFNSSAQYLTEGFNGESLPTNWTFIKNDHSNAWEHTTIPGYCSEGSGAIKYGYSSNYAADAWAITPAIHLTKDAVIQISFDYKTSGYHEKLELTVGNGATIDSQETSISDLSISNTDFKTEIAIYTVPATGDYFFGLNCHSNKDQETLAVDNIIIEDVPSCPKPSDLSVSNITGNSATLNWTSGGSDKWDIEWGLSGFTPSGTPTIDNTPNNPFNLTGLTELTKYEFYVRDDCSDDNSDASKWIGPISFKTKCLNSNQLPFSEGFESGLNKFINADENNTDFNLETTIVKEGTTSIHNAYGSNCNNSIITQCNIDLTGNDHPQLSFWHIAKVKDYYHKCQIQISVNGANFVNLPISTYKGKADYSAKSFDEGSYPLWNGDNGTLNNTWWKKETFDLSDYKTSSNVKIRFMLRSNSYYIKKGWYIDDIKIKNLTCPEPSNLLVNNITENSATLNWTTGGADRWDIEWAESGFIPTGIPIIDNTTNKPYTLSGLTPATEYEVYVRDDCSSDNSDASDWIGPLLFRTNCDGSNPLPVSEEFESGFDKFMNKEGNDRDFTLETSLVKKGITSIHNAYGSNCNNSIITQCSIDLTGNDNPELSFWHIAKTEGGYDKCHVQISVDGAAFVDLPKSAYQGKGKYIEKNSDLFFDEDSYNQWGSGSETPNNTWWKKETFSLIDYKASSNVKIKFKLESDNGTNKNGWYIDNIKIKNLTCPQPSNLNIANLTATSVDLNWTTGGSSEWDIEWGMSGFAPTGTPTINNTTNNPYSLSGLTEETTYDFYVRDDCSSDNSDASEWTGPFTFTTTASCPIPTNLTANIINAESVNLIWEGYASNNWDIEWGISGFIPARIPTINDITTNPYRLSGLKGEKTYDYYVRSDCGSDNTDVSDWAGPFSFSTPCGTVTPDYLEDFEIMDSETGLPSCWSKSEGPITGPTGNGETRWKADDFGNANNSMVGSIRHNLYKTGANDWLITPTFDLSAGGFYLIFDVAATKAYNTDPMNLGSDDQVQLLYSEDGMTWINLDTWNAANTPSTTGDHKIYDLSTITGNDVRFAFWAYEGIVDDHEDCNFYIDNFEVRTIGSGTDILTYSFPRSTGNTTIDNVTKTVAIEVGNGTDPNSLIATFTLSNSAKANIAGIDQKSGITANNFVFGTPITYTVVAENGSTQDWNITVTEAEIFTEANIITYSFAEQTTDAIINNTNHTVNIKVANGTNVTNISPTYTLSYGATTTQNTTNFSSPVTYTVIAEDGITTQDWTVTVTIGMPSTETDILTYSFEEQTGDATIDAINHTIDIEVESCTNITDLIANFTLSAEAKASVNNITQKSGETPNNFTNQVIYKIIAEDGTTTQDWTITVNSLPAMFIQSFPYFEGFEGSVMPKCWTILNEDGNSSKWKLRTDYAQEGEQSASISSYMNTNANDDWLITPLVKVNSNNLIIEFQAQSEVSNYLESYNVLMSKTGNTPTDFTTVLENVIDASSEWEKKSYKLADFGVTNGDEIYIAIQYVSINKYHLLVDAFTIRALNSETDILTYSFAEQTEPIIPDATNHTINIEVAYGTDITNIIPTFTLSDGATTTQATTDFSSPVTYTVIAEDGTTAQDWTVTVKDAPNSDASLSNLKVGETNVTDFNPTKLTYDVALPYGTTVIPTIKGTPTDSNANATITTTASLPLPSATILTVTAEDGITALTYTVNFTEISAATGNDILTFEFVDQTISSEINPTAHTITVKVGSGLNLTNLKPATFTLSDFAVAKIAGVNQVSGTTTNDFSNPVTYSVMAQNGTTQNWIVTVTNVINQNNQTDFLTYSFAEQTGDAIIDTVNHSIAIEVAYGTNITNITPTYTLSYGAITNQNTNDFSSPVTYTVIAEDGTNTQDWTVTVSVAKNNQTDILTYSFTEQTGAATINTANHTIDIEVAYGTNVSNITPTYTLSEGATTNQTTNNFSVPVTYKIIAEDGTTTQDWTVTVTDALNIEADILTYSFAEQIGESNIDATNHTIDIVVAYGTDISNIIPTYTLSKGATTNQTTTDFSSDVVYTITAENGTTTKNWTVSVTISVQLHTEADILTFSFAEQIEEANIDATNHTIDIVVAYGTDVSNIVPTYTLSEGATTTQTTTNFSSPVTYSVTAEDGATIKNWTVSVTVAVGINNAIKANQISIYPNPNNGQFNIDLNLSVEVTIKVVNVLGETVATFEKVDSKEKITLNLNNKKEGLYFVKISSKNNTVTKKVNIIR